MPPPVLLLLCGIQVSRIYIYRIWHNLLNCPLSTGSGAVALAHFDGSGVDEAVCTMVSRVQELALGYPEGRIELQLIGGYRDSQGYGEDVFYSIMRE